MDAWCNMRIYLYILITVTALSCAKESLKKDQLILGHAGAGTDYVNANTVPNTMTSIEQALLIYELDGVELDLQFSKDNKGFIYHDRTLQEQTNGAGQIYEQNAESLQGIQWKDARGDILLSLEELLEELSTNFPSVYVSLNIKNYDPDPDISAISTYLNNTLDSYDIKALVFIESDNTVILDSLESLDSGLKCLFNGKIGKEHYELVLAKGYDGLVDHHKDAEMEYIDSLQAKNKLAVLYGQLTSNDFQSSSTLKADVLQVDNPVLAIKTK